MTHHRIKHPSLELNWLPNSIRKGIPTPRLVVTDSNDYSGVFYHPTEDCEIFDMPLDKAPVIAISSTHDHFHSAVAHEFRHHWQLHNGLLGEGNGHWLHLFKSWKTYQRAIVAYFKTQPHEMDALRFERKVAPAEHQDMWWEWIVKDKEFPLVRFGQKT